jgi:HSP20 family protein
MAQTTPYNADLTGSGWTAGPFMMLNRLFEDVVRGGAAPGAGRLRAADIIPPRMDVTETENELRVTVELPGISEEDVDVSLDDDILTIRAEKKMETEVEKADHHLLERVFGAFQRTLRLPFAADPESVLAKFENGVLTLTIPKTKAQSRSRRIKLQRNGDNASAARAPEGGSTSAGGAAS